MLPILIIIAFLSKPDSTACGSGYTIQLKSGSNLVLQNEVNYKRSGDIAHAKRTCYKIIADTVLNKSVPIYPYDDLFDYYPTEIVDTSFSGNYGPNTVTFLHFKVKSMRNLLYAYVVSANCNVKWVIGLTWDKLEFVEKFLPELSFKQQ